MLFVDSFNIKFLFICSVKGSVMNSVILKDAFERKYTIQNNIITSFLVVQILVLRSALKITRMPEYKRSEKFTRRLFIG